MRELLNATRTIGKALRDKEILVMQQGNTTKEQVEDYSKMFLDVVAREWIVEDGNLLYAPLQATQEHQVSISTVVEVAAAIHSDKVFADMLDREVIYESPTLTVAIETSTSDAHIISIDTH